MRMEDLASASFRGLIFDMDGTLVDTMPVHYRAWQAVLSRHGLELPEAEFYELGGTPAFEIARMLIRREQLESRLEPEALARTKEELYLELLTEVPVIAGTAEIAHRWHGKVPLAVATGAKAAIAERVLTAAGLRHLFSALIAQEHYAKGKPAPDPYLRAAEAISIAPADCIVFEDTEVGLAGAAAAGMRCIHVVAPSRAPLIPGDALRI